MTTCPNSPAMVPQLFVVHLLKEGERGRDGKKNRVREEEGERKRERE